MKLSSRKSWFRKKEAKIAALKHHSEKHAEHTSFCPT
jgi:hypothetical protein